jgi:hypothetical protein
VGSPATVTLEQPGKLLVQLSGTFGVTCGATACSRTIGVTVDGQTVPGAVVLLNPQASGTASSMSTASGVVSVPAAGTHTVGIVEKRAGSPSTTQTGGDIRVVAIALGG